MSIYHVVLNPRDILKQGPAHFSVEGQMVNIFSVVTNYSTLLLGYESSLRSFSTEEALLCSSKTLLTRTGCGPNLVSSLLSSGQKSLLGGGDGIPLGLFEVMSELKNHEGKKSTMD